MIGFLEAFMPNLLATLIGVIVGLPIALYVNRRIVTSQQAYDKQSKAIQLNRIIDVLLDSFEYNINVLDSMNKLCLEVKVMRNPDLQTTTWDAIKIVFTPLCDNPELLRLLSHHWLRLQRLDALNQEMFAREVEITTAIKDQTIYLGTWGELFDMTLSLSNHAKEISQRLQNSKK